MPLKAGVSKTAFSDNLKKLMKEGYEQKQALAISYSKKREAEKHAKKK